NLDAGGRQVRYPVRATVIGHEPRADLVGIAGQPARQRAAQRGTERALRLASVIERLERARLDEPRAHLACREIVVRVARYDSVQQRGGSFCIAASKRELGLDLGDFGAFECVMSIGCMGARLIEYRSGGGETRSGARPYSRWIRSDEDKTELQSDFNTILRLL